MRGGTHKFAVQTTLTRDGTSGNHIKVFAYPGERPVIDAINQPSGTFAVIRMTSANWWHLKGLEIKNGAIQGIHTDSSSNNIFEQLNIHHTGRAANGGGTGTGLAIYGDASNVLVLNNDVHDNDDEVGSGGGGNGINVSNGGGTGNIIRGNRTWRNSDDGFDLWNKSPTLIENNWAWENGYDTNGVTPRGDGNGFKLGGNGPNDGGHTLKNNVSWKNRTIGFHDNSGDLPMTLYNNTAWNNGAGSQPNWRFTNSSNTFRNNLNFGNLGSTAGANSFNSWTVSGVSVSAAHFVSLVFDTSCVLGPRQSDGSLPNCDFLHLAAGSDLIGKGTNVGIAYFGSTPDLGAYEYGGSVPPSPPPPSPPFFCLHADHAQCFFGGF